MNKWKWVDVEGEAYKSLSKTVVGHFLRVQDDSRLQKRVQQLETELETCREEFQKQLRQKDDQHEDEVNLLKADMLVAIQVAQSGSIPPIVCNQQPGSQTSGSTITRNGVQLSLEVSGVI